LGVRAFGVLLTTASQYPRSGASSRTGFVLVRTRMVESHFARTGGNSVHFVHSIVEKRASPLVLIGLFKLTKAALLVALGVGLELPDRLAAVAERLMDLSYAFPGRGMLVRAAERVWNFDPSKQRLLGVFAFAYAAIFVVEGVGLLKEKRWAEWLTVVVTASFIPLELYEIARHFSIPKVVALTVNAIILCYLVWLRMTAYRGTYAGAG
jgi:uncharacterized membrane protein (DUF2068 family)